MISNTEVLWVVRHAAGTLQPHKPEFPFQEAIVAEPETVVAKEKKKVKPETVDVEELVAVVA